jgi:hypothetical protein
MSNFNYDINGKPIYRIKEFTKEDAFKVAEQKGRDDMKQEILKKIDKLIPFAELDKERWNDLINEIKKEIEK